MVKDPRLEYRRRGILINQWDMQHGVHGLKHEIYSFRPSFDSSISLILLSE